MSAMAGTELDALAARAAAADQVAPIGGAPGVPGGVPMADVDRARRTAELQQEIAGLLIVASKVVAPVMPRVAAIYSTETCEAVGAAVAPVCVKRGWLQGGLTHGWGEEISAAIVLVPLSIATYHAGQADVAAWNTKPPAPEGGHGKGASAPDGGTIEANVPGGVAIASQPGTRAANWEDAARKDGGDQ
jgi:hypothetical protein